MDKMDTLDVIIRKIVHEFYSGDRKVAITTYTKEQCMDIFGELPEHGFFQFPEGMVQYLDEYFKKDEKKHIHPIYSHRLGSMGKPEGSVLYLMEPGEKANVMESMVELSDAIAEMIQKLEDNNDES